MNQTLQFELARWRRQFPDISEEAALADLWHKGMRSQETYVAMNRRLAVQEDQAHGVVNNPDELRGWHCSVEPWKPGVLKLFRTRGMEAQSGFVSCDIFRVAIETGVCAKPDGYVTA